MSDLDAFGPTIWALIIATVIWPLVVLWLRSRELTQEERDEIYTDADRID